MLGFEHHFMTSEQAARMLGVTRETVDRLARKHQIKAAKVANRWVIDRESLEEFSRDYVGRRGRPRTKRKYTKRSPIWNA